MRAPSSRGDCLNALFAVNGILGLVVIEKSSAAFFYIGFYSDDAVMDVPDVNGRVFFHSVTASSSMRSRR